MTDRVDSEPAELNEFAGIKIMVIDDSRTIRRTAETLLKKTGCEIMMPRLDGYQTCSLIKNNPIFKATPVIMLSSKDGLFDRAKGRIVGSEQYLTKPFTKDELLATVRQFVGKQVA